MREPSGHKTTQKSPTTPRRFIGRTNLIHILINRLLNGDSCSIVGPPHIGKTTLLRHLQNEFVNLAKEYSNERIVKFLFFDCHMIPVNYTPKDFFRQLWMRIDRLFPEGGHCRALTELLKDPTEPWSMRELFSQLASTGRRTVLLLDEFDALFRHEHLHHSEFFGPLRSLSSTTDGGLTLITASRLSVADMNRCTQEQNPTGSPFFNNNIQLSLRPFTEDEVERLFQLSDLNNVERSLISAAAGRHPFLLESAIMVLIETRTFSPSQKEMFDILSERVSAHCADQWHCLSKSQQHALRMVICGEQQSSILAELSSALNHLCADGIVERNGAGFRIASGLLLDWIDRHIREIESAPSHTPLGRPKVRQLLNSVLTTDSSFDAFCLDYFPRVHRQFAIGMDREQRINLLLQWEELSEIVDALRLPTVSGCIPQ